MRLSALVLLLLSMPEALPAPVRHTAVDEALFAKGVRLLEAGKLQQGRSMLETLLRTYPASRFAEQARDTIEASRLFEDGQARLQSGRYGTARVTLQTLLYVYPESALAGQARRALERAAYLDEEKAPRVRSMQFANLKGVTQDEIMAWLRRREIGLDLEQPYRPEAARRAEQAIEDLLAERGQKGARVRAEVGQAAPDGVEVLFDIGR